MDTTSGFNWAVVGAGGICSQFLRTIETLQNINVIGALGSRVDKARYFLDDHGLTNAVAYETLDTLINDQRVDAVYIGTPHTLHFEYAKQLLLNDIPVLCEKPLTVNAEQSRQLVDIARKRRVFLMEALWTKTLPSWQWVTQLIDDDVIGELDHFCADFGFYFKFDAEHRLYNADLAGGVLLDLGVYPVSLIQMLAGVPQKMTGSSVLTPEGVDTKTLLHLLYDNHLTASICLTSQSTAHNSFWIYGSEGQIKVVDLFSAAQKVEVRKGDNITVETFPFESTGFEYQIRDAMHCIQSGLIEHPIITHDSTVAVMLMLDQLRFQLGILPNIPCD